MFRGPGGARTTNEKVEPAELTESVLGHGTRIRGRVGGDGDLRVEGHVDGEVRVSGQLDIEEGAEVIGDIDVGSALIAGSLKGDITARGPVNIRAGAHVEGGVGGEGVEVSLEEGASFQGRIDVEFDLPEELSAPQETTATRPAARAR